MNYGGLFQTGNPQAGGWRFPFDGRESSNSALQQQQTIDPEFLKRLANGQPAKPKGLLDSVVEAQPLQGLFEMGGNDVAASQGAGQAGGWVTDPDSGNQMKSVSPAGYSFGLDPKAGLKGIGGGLLGMLASSVTANRTAPVFDATPSFGGMSDYGRSQTANGPPNAAQAQALADELAKALGGYESGLFGGGYGGMGDAGPGGYGGGDYGFGPQ